MELDMALGTKIFMTVFPVLVLAGVIEGLVYTRIKKHPFSWKASVASLAVAVGHKLSALLLGGLAMSQFNWLYAHRVMTLHTDTIWGIALLFFCTEFFYYWQHRLSHEIRWFWASHAVHHSPEQLSLSAAYRLGWTGAASGMALLFAPLVLMGFSPKAVFLMLGANLVYQFWLHTELVPRLGWFDGIFNSPSNHRVHHASNAKYIDKNYGGVLMIFDRLFGTYVPEEADTTITYGLVGHAATHNPFVIALQEWRDLLHDAWHATSWRARLLYIFGRPGWKPDGLQKTENIQVQRPVSPPALQPVRIDKIKTRR